MVDPRRLLVILACPALLLAALGYFMRQPTPSGPPIPALADPARLERDVRFLSERLAPRDVEHRFNLDLAADHIKSQFSAAGGVVSEQPYRFEEMNRANKRVELGPFRNVIAAFGPDTAERIVVGAHYDAYGPFPGADDNASGTAGLLELARLLGRSPAPLRVELVAYSTEEPPYFATPHMGSALHAAGLKAAGVRIRAMISLEMIGCFSDEPGSQGYPAPMLRLYYPSRGDFITVVGNTGNIGLTRRVKSAMNGGGLAAYSITAPAFIPGIDYSDHASYWEQGYPAVMISDTAFYRNKRYHKPDDDADRLDYRRMAQVVDGTLAAIRDLARD
ncbi:MAG: M28 family peptidase [Elusimicrobia bacterium]|nr:M28 family peptidase [Elusimicrobiota bacterium]